MSRNSACSMNVKSLQGISYGCIGETVELRLCVIIQCAEEQGVFLRL